ncbi:hypothetical protein DCAR_0727023 [Daucus carota subsp. sativus]|uniref:Uncharacterized protein n=1 Tax=Daucus carota subsp. sativus TaxID=79200 RepID=A0AAF0XJI4_DAUCS|nr:hypothetical protein DCAR_0727023 [Daucus carota subsp. sativus]
MFPATLKKLTLVCTFLKWDKMQKIGMPPALEILNLQCEAFHGERWKLMMFMRIVQWSASNEEFPMLEHLKLGEYIHTLHHAIAQSAQRIKEDQVKKVTDCLKVSIFQA